MNILSKRTFYKKKLVEKNYTFASTIISPSSNSPKIILCKFTYLFSSWYRLISFIFVAAVNGLNLARWGHEKETFRIWLEGKQGGDGGEWIDTVSILFYHRANDEKLSKYYTQPLFSKFNYSWKLLDPFH